MAERRGRSKSKTKPEILDENDGKSSRRKGSTSPVKKLNPAVARARRGVSNRDTSESDSSTRTSSRMPTAASRSSDSSGPPTRAGLSTGSSRRGGESESDTPQSAVPIKQVVNRKPTRAEIDRETRMLDKTEETLKALKEKAAEKQVVLDKLLLEVKRMLSVFNKVKDLKDEPKDEKGQSSEVSLSIFIITIVRSSSIVNSCAAGVKVERQRYSRCD